MKSSQLKAYLSDGLLPSESLLIERHVEECSCCKSELEKIESELQELRIVGDIPPLPDAFTAEVANKLAQLPFPFPAEEKQMPVALNKPINWKKRSIDIMKKTAIAVAGLAAAVTFGTMVSPTFANYVNSLFNTVKDVDGGLNQAAVEGYVQEVNKQVTDKGITMIVKEVLADPTRIALIFDFVDKDGQKLDLTDLLEYDARFTLTDNIGNDLNPRREGWRQSKYGEYMLLEKDLYPLFDTVEKVPDELTVGVQFTQILGTEGSWKLDIPIDMKKAKKVAKTVEINKEYTTPQGVVIKLDKMVTVPSASLLTLETDWNEQKYKEYRKLIEEKGWSDAPEGQNLTSEEIMQLYLSKYGLAYEILDENGNLIAGRDDTFFGTLNGIRKNEVKTSLLGQGIGEGQGMAWWDGFVPFTGHKKLTFKLHSIYMNELASFQAKISLDELNKQPVTVENSGSTFTFSKFHLKTTEEKEKIGRYETSGKGGIIEFEATLPKDIVNITEWKAKDEKGNVYRVSMDNGDGEYTRGKDGRVKIKSALFIDGLEKQPKELTITYGIQEHQYRDVNWEVPIQLDK
ncbi:DUF4179 domain-containing protein [Brevibacillus borstelensis]|uniref:DUF4179 domain-containing protein n=1 Tax=Brevibacillus borstelensis TaxID=45462 RepID=UPI0030BEAAD3